MGGLAGCGRPHAHAILRRHQYTVNHGFAARRDGRRGSDCCELPFCRAVRHDVVNCAPGPQPSGPRVMPSGWSKADIEFLIQSRSVLVVDDNQFMRKIVRNLLMNIGVREVYEAADGIAGLDAIRMLGPDIVVLDWELPLLARRQGAALRPQRVSA